MINLARLNRLANAVRERTPASTQQHGQHNGQRGQSWYRIEARNTAGPAEIYVYDIIGEWGVTAGDFVNELRGLGSQPVDLHVNCEGGEIFDGLAIYEALCRYPAPVTGYVDGIAASSASFLMQACDERVMAKRSRMMIHDGHGLVIGNAADMREMADILDDLSDNIADIYAERAGGTRKQWRTAMLGSAKASDGTWYDAQAAVTAGLADRVGTSSAEDSITAPGGAGGNGRRHGTNVRPSGVRDAGPLSDDDMADFAASWNSGAFLSATTEATAEPKPPLDLSGLTGLDKLIPTNGKAGT